MSRIIKAEVSVYIISWSRRLRLITLTSPLDNSGYHEKPHPIIFHYFYVCKSLWYLPVSFLYIPLWHWQQPCVNWCLSLHACCFTVILQCISSLKSLFAGHLSNTYCWLWSQWHTSLESWLYEGNLWIFLLSFTLYTVIFASFCT